MRRLAPFIACAVGVILLSVLIPRFNSSQPHGIRLTRGEAQAIADREARNMGIPIGHAWSNISWAGSGPLEKELDKDPERRRAASDDPVIAPRLGGYKITYYRQGLEKFPPFGHVVVN